LPAIEQELQIARWERKQEQCRCGNDRAKCADPDAHWFPQRAVCFADMERRGAERMYELLHADRPYHDGTFTEWVKEPSRSHPYHFNDGVTIWVAASDVAPDDKFLSSESAPVGSLSERR
jgi:hypothetical protein